MLVALQSERLESTFKIARGLIGEFGLHRRVDGLKPKDFERYRGKLADQYGVHGPKNEVNRCRMVFKFGFDL